MKQRAAVTAMAMVLTAVMTASAQPGYFSTLEKHQQTDLRKAACLYTKCLKSENIGVIESALSHLVRMKLYVPELQCPELQEELNSLAATGTTPSVRYKAQIASLVFDSPDIFTAESAQQYENGTDLFNTVASRLQMTLVSNNGR